MPVVTISLAGRAFVVRGVPIKALRIIGAVMDQETAAARERLATAQEGDDHAPEPPQFAHSVEVCETVLTAAAPAFEPPLPVEELLALPLDFEEMNAAAMGVLRAAGLRQDGAEGEAEAEPAIP